MTSSNAEAWNMKHIWLNKFRSKHNLLMKFDSEEAYVLIWTSFESFTNTYLT